MNAYRNDLIVKAMAEQGKTNESLAHETHLSHATISAVRNGKPNVMLPTLKKVADALDLELVVKFEKKAA